MHFTNRLASLQTDKNLQTDYDIYIHTSNNYNVLSEILILNGLNFIGNHEDKINRIVKLEDRIAELLNSAQQQKEEFTAEISNLKEKLKNAEGITSNVPSTTELQSKEDAYRKTIAEADSLLSKMETEYQTTIKVCNS